MGDAPEESSNPVVVEERGPVAVICFNRPAERNTLSNFILQQLSQIVSTLSVRRDISALIFTGAEDVFASGANIGELSRLTSESARAFALNGQRLFQSIADARQLTIAAVNGYCMGGGLDLALACRVRCATPGAVFAHPGARLGIITGWGGTQRLPQLVGINRAIEMLLTGRRVTGVEALELGLVDYVDDDPLKRAFEIASSHHETASP